MLCGRGAGLSVAQAIGGDGLAALANTQAATSRNIVEAESRPELDPAANLDMLRAMSSNPRRFCRADAGQPGGSRSGTLLDFFSECGTYRWYIDPLAKRRGIPSDQLRGPARASLAN